MTMDRTRKGHSLRRIAVILGIATAIGVSPSVAQGESNITKTKHETVKNSLSNIR